MYPPWGLQCAPSQGVNLTWDGGQWVGSPERGQGLGACGELGGNATVSHAQG